MLIKNREVKGVIFDLDGTLLDSCSIWEKVDEDFFKRRNMELPSDYADAIGHIGLEKAAIYTIETFKLNEKKEDIIKEWQDAVIDKYSHEVKLKPHVLEFLSFLDENSIPYCVATANDEACYKGSLINNSIYDKFKFVLEVNKYKSGKDKPDIYLDACKRLNINVENCVVVEDLYMALKTAKDAGFMTVAVYEKTSKEEKRKEEIADIYIKDFSELL